MIGQLNHLTDLVETAVSDEIDVAAFAAGHGTTEYHLRRMFSSLAGMPLSEYVRRRRMTRAASDVVGGDALLDVAVRYGYGSTEAFGHAFRAVHGVSPADVRHGGAPFLSQPQIRFHLASLPASEHERLKGLSSAEPAGILQVTDDVDPDAVEGTELTYLHGVAVGAGADVPADLDTIEVAKGTWVVFRSAGPYPATLQQTWSATATDWFPSNPWRLRPGPSIVAVIDRADDFSSATTELWMPVEPADAG